MAFNREKALKQAEKLVAKGKDREAITGYEEIVKHPEAAKGPIEAIMAPAFPFVDVTTSVDALSGMLTAETPAVLVRDFKSDQTYIITRWDVIGALS